ncbi:MAG: hypothetical protein ACJ8AW_16460, partial [Rhodopila sp.]
MHNRRWTGAHGGRRPAGTKTAAGAGMHETAAISGGRSAGTPARHRQTAAMALRHAAESPGWRTERTAVVPCCGACHAGPKAGSQRADR